MTTIVYQEDMVSIYDSEKITSETNTVYSMIAPKE